MKELMRVFAVTGVICALTGCTAEGGSDADPDGGPPDGGGGDGGPVALECEGYDEADYPEVPVEFEIDGERAIMYGYVNGTTPGRVAALIEDHPEVELLIMPFVPGSDDDVSNLAAARMVREAGLDTCVPSTGLIASGGVDFFLAGVRRAAAEGALVGVHSWADGDGTEGGDLPQDSPLHDLFLKYYEEMGIPEAFYWFTLEAAPSWDIHWMTTDEIAEYALLTE